MNQQLRSRSTQPEEISLDALELTRFIKPGMTIGWGQGTAEPRALTTKLVEQRSAIVPPGAERVNVFLGVTRDAPLAIEHAQSFRFFGLGGLGDTARLSRAGVVDPVPARLGQMCALMRSGHLRFDVVLVQLSEPRDGFCSTGFVGDMVQQMIRGAGLVIGEINPATPYTLGDTAVAWTDLDVVIRSDQPRIDWPEATRTPEAETIAALIAERIPDGATLQVGIGAIPEALADALHDKKDLGVHSGMISDSIVRLVQSGAVTNARKPIDKGVSVTGLAFGTGLLAGWADGNGQLRMSSLDHTHGRASLSQLPDLMAINSAVEVDLTGQVNAETLGGSYIGGIGGQLDFIDAAVCSEGGRSIIALPSTARGGSVSRVVASFGDGVVTTARGNADLFVTEHGVADLRGASISERIDRMIAIAAPEHRDQLRDAARLL